MFLLTQGNREQHPIVCSDSNHVLRYNISLHPQSILFVRVLRILDEILLQLLHPSVSIQLENGSEIPHEICSGELQGNLTCHLSFRQHLSNLTIASYKTYYHFCAVVLWHPYSAHVHFLTSVKTMRGKQNQTHHLLKTVRHKRKSSDPDTLFPTYPSNIPTI
jgi:hypothetical protein